MIILLLLFGTVYIHWLFELACVTFPMKMLSWLNTNMYIFAHFSCKILKFSLLQTYNSIFVLFLNIYGQIDNRYNHPLEKEQDRQIFFFILHCIVAYNVKLPFTLNITLFCVGSKHASLYKASNLCAPISMT